MITARLAAIFALALCASVLMLATGFASNADAGPPMADTDGDDVFQDLEARLADLGPEEPVRVIVTLREEATAKRVGALEDAVGDFSVKRRFTIVDAFAATVKESQVRELAGRSGVLHVELDAVVHAANEGAQAASGVTAARAQVPGLDGDADGNLATYSKFDLVAAVIDTGIDDEHMDLDEGKVLAWKDYVNNQPQPYDDNGHGTHVAATLAGDGDARPADHLYAGVAPGAGLIGLKTLDSAGNGLSSNSTAAIEWVIENKNLYGIEAINLSLGSSGCSNGTGAQSTAVNAAHAAGLIVVVAAGNSGPGTCTIGAPGAAASALTVGNMTDTSSAGFFQTLSSSRGPTADGRIKPDVSAPGAGIVSAATNTVNGYATRTGTSMATPFAAGVALLMREFAPALSPQAVKVSIIESAVDWARGGNNQTAGTTGPDIDFGAGRLDAYAAIRAAGANISSPPAAPHHTLYEGSITGGANSFVDFSIPVTTGAHPLAATMIETGVIAGESEDPNFEVQLFEPLGSGLSSNSNKRQESVSLPVGTLGTYTLRVRSTAGNGPFLVDVSGAPDNTPETSFITGPSNAVASTTAPFTFTSEAGSTFECRLDSGTWAVCASPTSPSGLSQGEHIYRVRAKSATGIYDETPAVRIWAVDTVAPDTTLAVSGPTGAVASASAEFTFSSPDASAGFECKLDGADWEANCVSPKQYTGLAQGERTFQVRAKDAAGNLDATPPSRVWTVDTVAPDTTLAVSGPTGIVASTSAEFTFSSPDGSATFECKLDGADWEANCVSPKQYTGLAQGARTFQVRAKDPVGNVDPTPPSRAWTVDTVAPDTTLAVSGPSGAVSSTSAVFTFSSPDGSAGFECKLDGADWEANCVSPKQYSGIAQGARTFQVRAKDPVGNLDATPASRTWTVDTVAPDTALAVSGPTGIVASTSAEFTFSSPDGSATFECKLDGADWEANCVSPKQYTGLAQGSRTFQVRAKDPAGNLDGTPPSRTWTVDTVAPDTTLAVSGPTGPVSSSGAEFTFSSPDGSATFECKLDGADWEANCVSPKQYTGLAQGEHTFQVRAKDPVGNLDATPPSRTWTVDMVAPDTALAVSGPSGTVASASAEFTFSSPDGSATFECKLDGADWEANCVSPKQYTGLAQGSRTFQVRAKDAAGNLDATPPSRTWTVDTVAPDTTLAVSGPNGIVASTSAEFTFSSPDGSATFECKLDGADWQANCSSPKQYTGLPPGARTFQVRAKDLLGNTDASPAIRTWTVFVNAPPAAVDDSVTVAEDSGATNLTVLANDTDAEGDAIHLTAVSTPPEHGTATLVDGNPGDVAYTPTAGYCGPDSVTYTVSGGASATVSVTVMCVDDPPIAAADSKTVAEDAPAGAVDVLANDTDVDGGSKAVASKTDPAHGTVAIEGGGVTYRPSPDYCGPDSFTYALNGGSTASAALTVSCVDDAPVAVDDARTTAGDRRVVLDVLVNDTDIDGGPKLVSAKSNGAHGQVAVVDGGVALSYTPAASYCGSDSFTYALNGGSEARVAVTVACVVDGVEAPETTITKAPKRKVRALRGRARVAFRFRSSKAGSTFRCKLDRGPVRACRPAASYRLKVGKHTFSVFAVDALGLADATPAIRKVKVVAR
jgi:subtilisin family serine protease